jgi:Domain of unknown function (DUF5069)
MALSVPPPRAQIAGCIWLPRLLAKARQFSATPGAMGEYMFGQYSYFDIRMLRFLRTDERTVCELVRDDPDDESVARRLIAAGGRSPDEVRAFNRRFGAMYGLVFKMIDADEGRIGGPLGAVLRSFYNGIIFPPAAVFFRRPKDQSPEEPLSDAGPNGKSSSTT